MGSGGVGWGGVGVVEEQEEDHYLGSICLG